MMANIERYGPGRSRRPNRKEDPPENEGRIRWFYPVLALIMAVIIVDRLLPEKAIITEVKERHDHSTRSHTITVVETADGSSFQTLKSPGNFRPGGWIELRNTPILGNTVSFRLFDCDHCWHGVEAESSEYRPLPYLVLIGAVLLLFSGWKTETRWLIKGLMLMALFAWLLILLATGVFKRIEELTLLDRAGTITNSDQTSTGPSMSRNLNRSCARSGSFSFW